MAEPWPRRYHLHIVQSREMAADFDRLLTRVLLEEDTCIVIESPPHEAGIAKNGKIKFRGCVVQVRDVLCMTSMHSRLQQNSITCRSRKYSARD
jgi:hypothetical protein